MSARQEKFPLKNINFAPNNNIVQVAKLYRADLSELRKIHGQEIVMRGKGLWATTNLKHVISWSKILARSIQNCPDPVEIPIYSVFVPADINCWYATGSAWIIEYWWGVEFCNPADSVRVGTISEAIKNNASEVFIPTNIFYPTKLIKYVSLNIW